MKKKIKHISPKTLRLEDMPEGLKVEQIAAILQISKANAYALVKREGFPLLTIGKRLIIPKAEFQSWITNNTKTSNVNDY